LKHQNSSNSKIASNQNVDNTEKIASRNLIDAASKNEDDTDHDLDANDEDMADLLMDNALKPPPIPKSDPPPLPSAFLNQKNSKNSFKDGEVNECSAIINKSLSEQDIKKALLDNIKTVDNWKQEQEILMKKKYEEEQKRIELALRLDLEKVKEEEIQRREQVFKFIICFQNLNILIISN
jgi:hypothetical protein